MKKRVKRVWMILIMLSLIVSLCGCNASIPFLDQPDQPRPTPVPVLMTKEPEPELRVNPAEVIRGVETEKKVVSLIFEGFSDSATMEAISDILSQERVPSVFFLSGITVDEYPDMAYDLMAKGNTIGNYGMSGKKNLEAYTPYQNSVIIQRAQDLIKEACGVAPTLIRCNGTVLNDGVLRAAAAAGLKAAVEPTVYINHRSFKSSEEAETFVQGFPRGSILSVKLGQELDLTEYGEPGEKLDERPAIDPPPNIRWNWDLTDDKFAILPDIVSWIVDAFINEGYTFVLPENLKEMEEVILPQVTALQAEDEILLDIDHYTIPVTKAPLTGNSEYTDSFSHMGNMVIVGDTVMEGLSDYVSWRREQEPEYLPNVQFLTDSGKTVDSVLKEIDSGEPSLPEQLSELRANSVWLCLDYSTPSGSRNESCLKNYRLLIHKIQEKNPDIRVVVMTVLPRMGGIGSTDNLKKFSRNLMLCRMCKTCNIDFVDSAYAVRDVSGNLRESFCLDKVTYGRLLNDAGCEELLSFMQSHIPV